MNYKLGYILFALVGAFYFIWLSLNLKDRVCKTLQKLDFVDANCVLKSTGSEIEEVSFWRDFFW
jgi:hypothetical protein